MSVVNSSSKTDESSQLKRTSLKVAIVAVLILICIGLIYYFHWIRASEVVFTHFFYVPIILAGFLWGKRGVLVSILLGVLLMTSHFLSGLGTPYREDLLRSVMFVVVGLTVGILREQALRAEEKIKRIGYQHELILNSAGDGIVGLDSHGKITFINSSALKMVGLEAEDLIGKFQHAVMHHSKKDGTPYAEEECLIHATLKDGAVHVVDDEVFWRKDGTSFPVRYTSTPIRERDNVAGAVIVFRDITERKRAEEALKTKERQLMLAHASRLSTLGEMATAMAHEINQPLTIISMAAEGILRDIRKNRIDMTLISQDLEDVLKNVRRIDTIITHMRTFARQPGVLKVVKPAQILDNAFIIVGEQFRVHDISVSRHIEENLPHIEVDPNQLEQVFINILTNARQVLDEKGETAKRAGESFQKQLKCGIFRESDHVVFEFSDNGYGVSDDVKSRIFEPFFTTKEPGEGTGLGLSIAYGIITQSLKGRIWVEDNEMGGATFKVALPIKNNDRTS